jgi:hypothetical protein
MRRRTFLGLMGALAAAGAGASAARRSLAAAADRLTWWDPATLVFADGQFVALEWRYLAGRVAAGDDDFGFVVSLSDYNPFPGISTTSRNELLVMRQQFGGAGAHATNTYPGTLSYDAGTTTYSFVATANPAITATWRLDAQMGRYTLSVASPELLLDNLLITPVGGLIPEGGAGVVSSGVFRLNNLVVDVASDYYADWAVLSSGGGPVGVGRLDMQTLRPNLSSGPAPTGFSHHWFAAAATLADDTPAWVSGWQIVTGPSAAWGVTVATGSGPGWDVSSVGSDSGFVGAQPLEVTILEFQPIPTLTPPQRTGRRWRLRAGQGAAGDLIDLELAVQPGQFIKGARVSEATSITMQEAVGTGATGTVGGKVITTSSLAILESTYGEPDETPDDRLRTYLPLVVR